MAARILLLLVLFIASGCSTPDAETEERPVSSIPWNKPQKWEKSGATGQGAGVGY